VIYQLQSDSYLSTFKDADLWSAFKMCKGVKSAPIKPKSGFFGHSGTFYTDSEDETSTVDEISTSKTNTTRRKNEKSNRGTQKKANQKVIYFISAKLAV